MQWRRSIGAALCSLALFSGLPAPAGAQPATPYKIVTASERGTYIQIGRDLAKFIAPQAQIELDALPSAGSAENIHRLRYEPGVKFALVQSEWYLGQQNQTIDINKASAAAPAPDMVVFNGVANQYADHPIEVPVGETVRVFVLNAGPSVDSSFHVVGTIFHEVIKEGIHLQEGNAGNWGSQAVDLSPAQGAIIEMRFDEDGLYPIVTHAFNFVGRGALGLFKAGDGGAPMEGGH